jgi:aminobenzoyl-glutamate utilization protein B
MTNCTLDIEVQSAVWPVRGNRTMAEVIQRNAELIGMPQWTDAEISLARALQQKAAVKVEGLRAEITPMRGPTKQIAASNDCGDVSWVVPMARVWFPGNIPNVGFHHWAAGVALATSIAHKGGLAGAKALAASALDFFMDPELIAKAKATFREEIGDVPYTPLLPADQKPPLELNLALMERFRPAMRKRYLTERPQFVD